MYTKQRKNKNEREMEQNEIHNDDDDDDYDVESCTHLTTFGDKCEHIAWSDWMNV